MNKVNTVLAMILLLASCSTTRLTQGEKAVKREGEAREVARAIDARRFTIEIKYMYPTRWASRALNYGYKLEVSGDSVMSYLPYFGRAYDVPYGGGDGLSFNASMSSYDVEHAKNGMTRVKMTITNSEDTYSYMLQVFDNGRATLDVNSRQREPISFSGDMILGDNK